LRKTEKKVLRKTYEEKISNSSENSCTF
jgi:hypothetical protein